ncbi:hypothetical protein FSB73_17740 [Arachidicoccus ginsenosidivorans]|uniref:Transposase IS801/IS1294 domain-containing protein n=1 Tax=Arachidicoccus ginsenosidivorans TaxID=496057 RepID=A0A5B8VNX6_9BACT|nr:hypothetical protein FSB73_17740 [Arachidicoccus ginsenosidivorans]
MSFSYKEYKKQGKEKSKKRTMLIDVTEFIRRFAIHILERGLVRIRHYGFLCNASKKDTIPLLKLALCLSYIFAIYYI